MEMSRGIFNDFAVCVSENNGYISGEVVTTFFKDAVYLLEDEDFHTIAEKMVLWLNFKTKEDRDKVLTSEHIIETLDALYFMCGAHRIRVCINICDVTSDVNSDVLFLSGASLELVVSTGKQLARLQSSRRKQLLHRSTFLNFVTDVTEMGGYISGDIVKNSNSSFPEEEDFPSDAQFEELSSSGAILELVCHSLKDLNEVVISHYIQDGLYCSGGLRIKAIIRVFDMNSSDHRKQMYLSGMGLYRVEDGIKVLVDECGVATSPKKMLSNVLLLTTLRSRTTDEELRQTFESTIMDLLDRMVQKVEDLTPKPIDILIANM